MPWETSSSASLGLSRHTPARIGWGCSHCPWGASHTPFPAGAPSLTTSSSAPRCLSPPAACLVLQLKLIVKWSCKGEGEVKHQISKGQLRERFLNDDRIGVHPISVPSHLALTSFSPYPTPSQSLLAKEHIASLTDSKRRVENAKLGQDAFLLVP